MSFSAVFVMIELSLGAFATLPRLVQQDPCQSGFTP